MARGGKREGAGRKTGAIITEAKRELSAMAQEHAPQALKTLVDIARNGKQEAARVAAANALLDRAYGKPPQALEHTGKDGGPVQVIISRDDATVL